MQFPLNPHDLISRMYAAFGSLPYPGDDRLITRPACRASERLRDDLRGRTPGAVRDEVVLRHYDGLSLLSPEARRYYLPAYVRAALRVPDSDVAEFLLYSLGGDLGWQLGSGFTGHQRAAVVAYLESLTETMDEIFWEQISEVLTRWRVVIPLVLAA